MSRIPAFPSRRHPGHRANRLATSLLGALLLAGSAPALAAARWYDVPAAPLRQALAEFSTQAGVAVTLDGRLADSLRSRALSGEFEAADGLARLLEGTGLQAVPNADGFVVREMEKATTLDKVEVTAADPGYVARHTVTATRTDTPLRDVPQSIAIVTQQLMRDQAMQNMADVVRNIPGFGMAQGEGNRDAPILRGTASTADFFVDGLRDDAPYYRDLYNVERVEGLKGPNAMIFGRGGSGGLINRVSKQADWEPTRELTLLAGSWSNRRLTADFDQPLGDTVAWRVTGVYENSDSYRDGVTIERKGVNPTVSFRPGERTLVSLGYEYFDDDRVADRGIPSLGGVPLATSRSTFFGDPSQSPTGVTVHAFSALVDHVFDNGLSLRNRTRWANYDKFYQNVFPGAVNAAAGTVAISAYNNQTDRTNLINQTDLNWEVSTGAIRHTLLAGVELARQETDNQRLTGYFTSLGANVTSVQVPITDPRTRLPIEFRASASDADNHGVATTAAVYLQDQITLSPQWQAILGIRHDDFDVDFRNNRNGARISSRDGLVSPRAGLVYKPVEPLSLYASYSVAYVPRAGEQLASLTPTNAAFDPEKFENVELGAKWDVRPDLAFTAAVYRLDRSNVVVPDPNDPTVSILVDGQRVRGVELGLAGNVTDRWSVMAAYAHQDGEITATQSASVRAGNRLAQMPRNLLSLWNRYDFSPSWGIGLGAIHSGSLYAANDNLVQLPSFNRIDAAVYYTVNPRLHLQLNIENLFDETYYASAHSNNNITPGAPRAARLSLTAKF